MLDVFLFPDDDDSKSQDKIDEGPVGGQRTTTAAAVASGGSGTVASSSHNFLLSLMGGGDPFGPGVHINIPVISSGVTAAQHSGTSLDSPAGNGRQTLLTDTNTAADQFVSFTDLQTEVTGGADSVTSLHVDLTASGLGLTHDVTESTPVILHTASGGSTHTDLVTMAADSTGTDSGHPAVTDHTQMAGSVTEQYNPSGQGPEGSYHSDL
ncbi:uncharacterized protein AB9X84_005466 [Acanthopagrus schlegelii]